MEEDILEMCDDEQMDRLRVTFLKSGRGCRHALPHIDPTNKLLLQLNRLRREGKKSVTEMELWFSKLCPEVKYPAERILRRIPRVIKKAREKDGVASRRNFLEEIVDFDSNSDSLDSIGVTRSFNRQL